MRQLRYFKQNDQRNFPIRISVENLTDGSVFKEYLPCNKIVIFAPKGTKFMVNNKDSITLEGATQYVYTCSTGRRIYSLKFDEESMLKIKENNIAVLGINMYY